MHRLFWKQHVRAIGVSGVPVGLHEGPSPVRELCLESYERLRAIARQYIDKSRPVVPLRRDLNRPKGGPTSLQRTDKTLHKTCLCREVLATGPGAPLGRHRLGAAQQVCSSQQSILTHGRVAIPTSAKPTVANAVDPDAQGA